MGREKDKSLQKQKTCTYIGGQAVLEGVMMRGKRSMACAVRDDMGNIQIEAQRITPSEQTPRFFRLPFVRGVVNLISSMTIGIKTLMRSAEVYSGEGTEEPSKFEKWLATKLKMDVMQVVMAVALVLGILLSVGLFVFLPYFISSLVASWSNISDEGIWFNLLEGVLRVAIFIAYILLTSLLRDIRRTYMYHGAEHKTITCFEQGMPLTVENVKGCSRVHDRCGTTFMFFVMIIAILVFSLSNSLLAPLMNIQNAGLEFLVRFLIKLLLLPVVAGLSYELLRVLAKTKSPLVAPLKAPGLALQYLTTREPDEGMIECAIAAFERVQKMDADPTAGESSFAVGGKLSQVKAHIDELFSRAGIEGEDCLWILSLTLNIPVSRLDREEMLLSPAQAREIFKIVNQRLSGRPLWYIIGDTSFCGYTLKVDERVLIPRPETEILVENAVKEMKEGARVLDLCTGSGAIAVAIKKMCERKNVTLTAVDISQEALALATENAQANGADISFIHSNLFENVQGKFDVILSNPPYIAKGRIEELQREVKNFEPHLALDGGEDGLDFYRRIANKFDSYLKSDGFMLLELGMGQANEVRKMFENKGATTAIIKDLAGIDRILKVTLTEKR